MRGATHAAVIALLAVAVATHGASPQTGSRGARFMARQGRVRTASVHDPSVFKDRNGTYHIFGTHLASAKSANMISWTQTDTLLRAIDKETAAKIREWNADEKAARWQDYLWAPDVVYNAKMRKYCVYLSVNGDGWKSNIVLLTGDRAEGPFKYAGTVVYGGFSEADWRETDVAKVLKTERMPGRYVSYGVKNGKWGLKYPNCIDPCVFYDDTGRLWMSYGSWSGGIFLLALDGKTGLRDMRVAYADNAHSDPYFGRKIAGGSYASGEGSYICRIGGWYWLFVSYGKLEAKGGYNIRVFRSKRPEGPYEDKRGNTPFYDTYRLNFNDGVGVRLFGGCRWKPDESGLVAQGHNSALVDDDGRAYIVFHTRTTEGHEGHYIRVHQLFLNRQGWLVAAPYRMRGERLEKRGLPAKSIAGDYDLILHRLDIDYARLGTVGPERITLREDKTIAGARTGRWDVEPGTPYITLTLNGKGAEADVYQGVALVMAIDGTNEKTVVFTALGDRSQLTVWGSRIIAQD